MQLSNSIKYFLGQLDITTNALVNPRRACAARVTVVVMSVCLSVRYTSGASFRPENAVTYSAGNEGQNICGVFSETAPLQRSSIPSNDGNTYRRPLFVRKARMRIIVFTTWWTGAEQPFLPVCWCREGGLFVSSH